MFSRKRKEKSGGFGLVTLPTCCIPTSFPSTLDAKRDAQLRWMHEEGIAYLGDAGVGAPRRKVSEVPRPSRGPGLRISSGVAFAVPIRSGGTNRQSDAA
jgi:hypothetical protein